MPNWREYILRDFTPQVARLTIVADPDGLLVEEGILQGIRERGFELIQFDDHVAFRFAYESKFRSRWDRGEQTDLVVVLRSESSNLKLLPYDLLEAGRKLSFSLGDLFPNLSYPVVSALDRGDFNALYLAQTQYNPGVLGDNAAKDFILRHVFEIAPELIKQPSDLLRVLLRRHYRGQRIPRILDERFIEVLRHDNLFHDWPLEKIVPDRDAFLSFLQERWIVYLDRMTASNTHVIKEGELPYGLKFAGPLDIPFDHDDVRIYIDNMFLEGLLQSVSYERSDALRAKWFTVGIRTDPAADRLRRLNGLIQSLKSSIPAPDARHQDWLLFASRWAEVIALSVEIDTRLPVDTQNKIESLQSKIDSIFLSWVERRYAGLHNQPASPPVMLHHIPRALARHMERSKKEKVALLLLDGLALDQWIALRNVLREKDQNIQFHEGSVFAWIPTITSISRQAAFAGKAPLYFPSSIQTTDKESAQWSQFWSDHGLTPKEVAYVKGLGNGSLDMVEEILANPEVRIAGLVVDKVDRIMHGMELGTRGMHNQIHQWAMQGFMTRLIDLLLAKDFCIFLTSDHGNIEAKGCGRLAEGVIAELRGQRVRIYSDSLMRSQAKGHFPTAIEWPPYGLPDDFMPLLAPGRSAFIREGEQIVGHGGISIEELIVPLIRIEKKL